MIAGDHRPALIVCIVASAYRRGVRPRVSIQRSASVYRNACEISRNVSRFDSGISARSDQVVFASFFEDEVRAYSRSDLYSRTSGRSYLKTVQRHIRVLRDDDPVGSDLCLFTRLHSDIARDRQDSVSIREVSVISGDYEVACSLIFYRSLKSFACGCFLSRVFGRSTLEQSFGFCVCVRPAGSNISSCGTGSTVSSRS